MKLKSFKLGMHGQIVIDNFTRLKPLAEVDVEYDPKTENLSEVVEQARTALNVLYYVASHEAIEEFECSGGSHNVKTLTDNSKYSSMDDAIKQLENVVD